MRATIEQPVPFIATLFIAAAVGLTTNLLPLVNEAWTQSRGLMADMIGVNVSLELAGSILVTLAAPLWIGRVNWRICCAIGAALAASCNFALIMTSDLDIIHTLLVLSGVSWALIYTPVISFAATARHPERFFGMMFGAQIFAALLAFFGLSPFVMGEWALEHVFIFLGSMKVLALAATWFLPAHNSQTGIRNTLPRSAKEDAKPPLDKTLAALILGGMAATSFGAIGMWSFLSSTSQHAHLMGAFVHHVAGFALLASLCGSLFPIFAGNRFGAAVPIFMAGLCGVLPAVIFAQEGPAFFWASGVLLLSFGWSLGSAYVLGLAARHDGSGLIAPLSNAARGMGAALAPVVLGNALAASGYSVFLVLAGSAMAAGTIAFLAALVLCKTSRELLITDSSSLSLRGGG